MKKILFLTGTRADYGKIKSLIKVIDIHPDFESFVFITGMHMMQKYGYTASEIIAENHQNIYLNINQESGDRSEIIISNTIRNLSQYIHEIKPDLLVVHGDRIEALAGVIAGVFSNILVAHIEGGESSGSIDESIRHSISKLSHVHFVANEIAGKKLQDMGELKSSIYPIGSPDFDALFSNNLPNIGDVRKVYDIPFDDYGIFIFHSVTSEIGVFENYCSEVIKGLVDSNKQFILIYPNNDPGTDIIIDLLQKFTNHSTYSNFKLFHSIPFTDFLTILKNAKCIVGNSSAGVRQAPVVSVPTINIGSRQNNRNKRISIYDLDYNGEQITNKINELRVNQEIYPPCLAFGDGTASVEFMSILESDKFRETSFQK